MISSVIGSPRVRVDLATQPYRGFADDHREAARPLQRNGKRAVGRLRYRPATPSLGTRPVGAAVDLTERTDKILAGNRHGAEQRRCCAGSRSVAACRNQMVPKGRRHATSDVQILGEAALRALPVIGGARGDRTAQGAGLFHTGDWASPRAGSLDNLP